MISVWSDGLFQWWEKVCEAYEAGHAPPIKLNACHNAVLHYVPLNILVEYAV